MNPTTARFLLDECLGKPIVEPLSRLNSMGGGEKPDLRHILDLTAPGTRDEVWIPSIAREGWTVITADRGSTPNKQRGEKLPRLCARFNVRHILLSPAVQTRTGFEKLLTILSVWYKLIDIADDPTAEGNRYIIEPHPSGERGLGKLIPKSIPPELLAIRAEYLASSKVQSDETEVI